MQRRHQGVKLPWYSLLVTVVLRVVGNGSIYSTVLQNTNAAQRWHEGVKLPWSSLASHGIIVVPFQPICPLFNVGTTVDGIRGTTEHPRRCYVAQIVTLIQFSSR